MVDSLAVKKSELTAKNRAFKIHEDTIPVDDYRQIAQQFDWKTFTESAYHRSFQRTGTPILKVLDLACGTGRWLQTFLQYVSPQLTTSLPLNIRYDLLDCCESALIQATQKVRYPFKLGTQHLAPVQQAALEPDTYDCIWSMHGFYAMPKTDLGSILAKINHSLHQDGRCLIAQASHRAFYINFYDRYRAAFGQDQGTGFTAAEDIIAALKTLGIEPQVQVISYDECIPLHNMAAVEHYILNEATINSFNRDDTVEVEDSVGQIGLQELWQNPAMNAYLNSLVWDSTFHFPEEVWLISFGKV
ncbi:class I SAM-dependent methyltransferase [Almyronema epifaneia]|uniref:Class I SAM-dependent methyltransferase n=1 Tax=Almyronema epifaneia S1 TaxID=2991925 RepID=A0ABW6IIF1_9CYAN